jgi:cell division protein FtsN
VRATDVATAIAALPEPVRQRSAGGWEQVIAGPYASADQARAAQQRLERAGFTGTHIAPAAR